jgi:hypothetical protein
VLLSHDHHADNLDDDGRALLPSAGAVVTTDSGARRLGDHARGLAPWATTTLQALWMRSQPWSRLLLVTQNSRPTDATARHGQ